MRRVAVLTLLAAAVPATPTRADGRSGRDRVAHAHAHRHRHGTLGGPRGILRVREARRARAAAATTCLSNPCLTYHGGPVLQDSTAYVIYWQPSNASTTTVKDFPAGYRSVIDQYMSNVAADSAALTNVYSVTKQYSDSSGGANFAGRSFAYGASYSDTDALAAQYACIDPQFPGYPCVTDAGIMNEINAFLTAHPTLPRGLGSIYLLVTPEGLTSCLDNTGGGCYANTIPDSSGQVSGYCGYHNDFVGSGGQTILYANLPYAKVSGCSAPSEPNNNPADDTLSVLSHEQIEVITDPLGRAPAWYHSAASGDPNSNYEIADLCNTSFGPPGGTSDQLIHGFAYELQAEWSNQLQASDPGGLGCALGLPGGQPTAPTVTLVAPAGPLYQGQAANFTASSRPGASYDWSFGDGFTRPGAPAAVSHAYLGTGTFDVTVRAVDPASNTVSAPGHSQVSVLPATPAAAFSVTPATPAPGQAVTLDGSASVDAHGGGIVSWQWSFGDGGVDSGAVVQHAFAGAGTYTVQLAVRNSFGSSSTSVVTVIVAWPPAPPTRVSPLMTCQSLLARQLLDTTPGAATLTWLAASARRRAAGRPNPRLLAYAVGHSGRSDLIGLFTAAGVDPARALDSFVATARPHASTISFLSALAKAVRHRSGVPERHRRQALPAACRAIGSSGRRFSVFTRRRGHRATLLVVDLG